MRWRKKDFVYVYKFEREMIAREGGCMSLTLFKKGLHGKNRILCMHMVVRMGIVIC